MKLIFFQRFSFTSFDLINFRYAITRLKQAPDDDLVLYLLQLVQALKYENFDDIEVTSTCISLTSFK